MIYIEESLYRYYKEQGIYLPEKETIVVPDHKTKEGLITFCPERMTKTRRKQREEEKKKALAYDLGYDKLKKEYEEEIRKRNAGNNNN